MDMQTYEAKFKCKEDSRNVFAASILAKQHVPLDEHHGNECPCGGQRTKSDAIMKW